MLWMNTLSKDKRIKRDKMAQQIYMIINISLTTPETSCEFQMCTANVIYNRGDKCFDFHRYFLSGWTECFDTHLWRVKRVQPVVLQPQVSTLDVFYVAQSDKYGFIWKKYCVPKKKKNNVLSSTHVTVVIVHWYHVLFMYCFALIFILFAFCYHFFSRMLFIFICLHLWTCIS